MGSHRTEPRRRLNTRARLLTVAVLGCYAAAPAWAQQPTGMSVQYGSASQSVNGNVLTVTNSNGAILHWDSFSIGKGYTTHFQQPSASSSVLNRVVGASPSQIYGTLSSNGKVWLINPNGIVIGPTGVVDTAGFVASTLNVSDANFLAGKLTFDTPGAGDVVNQGSITTASGGSVYLIGSNVSNDGVITTPQGETILAAGKTVEIADTGTPGVKVKITGAAGNATNLGSILAAAGRIGMAGVMVKNSGLLNASSVSSEGGRIFLKATQDTSVEGNSKITAMGTKGGKVEVLGNRVAVMGGAEIDVSGTNGGGTILVGGDYQGKNADVQNAQVTYFGAKAKLKADAIDNGDGGKVIVWSDDTTRAYGSISARGGANGGNGGFVETSSHRYLDFHAHVDRSAPKGKAGTLLLDPENITILDGVDSFDPTAHFGGLPPYIFSSSSAQNSFISWATIDNELALGDVIITTTSGASNPAGNITIQNSHSYTKSSSLSLLAHNDILAAGVTVTNLGSGGLTLVAGWNGLSTSAPDVGSGAGTGKIAASGATFQTSGGNIVLKARGDIDVGTLDSNLGQYYQAGNIDVRSYGGHVQVDTITALGFAANSDAAGNGGKGGNVTLQAHTDVRGGTIDASGGDGWDDGTTGNGGNGGLVSIIADTGTVDFSSITANGGAGSDAYYSGQAGYRGGNGGSIDINTGGAINISIQVNASGGNGGNGDGMGRGGDGGSGGSVSITSGSDMAFADSLIQVLGGDGGGGGGANSGGDGGNGGNGGTITLTATGALDAQVALDATGGSGGNGGWPIDGYGGSGGNGGGGGTINISAGSLVSLAALTAVGGDGGSGNSNSGSGAGNGGNGGNGGAITIHATTADFSDSLSITATGGAGGDGGDNSWYGGNGGTGGNGGSITLSGDYVNVYGMLALDNVGGDGGLGGSGQITNGGAGAAGTAGTNTVKANAKITIGSRAYLYSIGSLTLSAPTIYMSGGYASSDGSLTVHADNLEMSGGSSLFGAGVTIDGGNMTLDGSTIYATGDFRASLTGNMTLKNGSSVEASNDAYLTLKGTASTLSLSNNSWVWANNPDIIHLLFASRTSGGILIDGVATTATIYPGSGFYVGANQTPAGPGAGLDLLYGGTTVGGSNTPLLPPPPPSGIISAILSSTTGGTPPPPIVIPPPPTGGSNGGLAGGGSVGGGDNEFGGGSSGGKDQDDKSGKSGNGKDDKPPPKPLGKCSA